MCSEAQSRALDEMVEELCADPKQVGLLNPLWLETYRLGGLPTDRAGGASMEEMVLAVKEEEVGPCWTMEQIWYQETLGTWSKKDSRELIWKAREEEQRRQGDAESSHSDGGKENGGGGSNASKPEGQPSQVPSEEAKRDPPLETGPAPLTSTRYPSAAWWPEEHIDAAHGNSQSSGARHTPPPPAESSHSRVAAPSPSSPSKSIPELHRSASPSQGASVRPPPASSWVPEQHSAPPPRRRVPEVHSSACSSERPSYQPEGPEADIDPGWRRFVAKLQPWVAQVFMDSEELKEMVKSDVRLVEQALDLILNQGASFDDKTIRDACRQRFVSVVKRELMRGCPAGHWWIRTDFCYRLLLHNEWKIPEAIHAGWWKLDKNINEWGRQC